MSDKPKALELAERIPSMRGWAWADDVTVELRSLHDECERLRADMLTIRKKTAQECVAILLDGDYWNGAPQIAFQGAQDRAKEIRRVFALEQKGMMR